MADPKLYWLISIPRRKGGEESLAELNRATLQEKELSRINYVYKFPELRVGNIDSLISLSDVLKKVNSTVEQTLHKIAQQYFDLQKDKTKRDIKEFKNIDAEASLNKFQWDDTRYPRRKSLTELTSLIRGQIVNMEKELRERSLEYNTCMQRIAQVAQSESGSLQTRDLTKDLAKAKFQPVESEYLTTLLVVIPRSEIKKWYAEYETLTPHVVPRSSTQIAEDGEFYLLSVVLFSRDAEDFKNKARNLRFTVRKNDPNQLISDEEKTKLNSKAEKLQVSLSRWTQTNFAEAYSAWLHLKCIQCYVESILRFGLPADFAAMLLLPKKGQEKRLEKSLCKLYSYLGRDFEEDEKEIANASEDAKGALVGVEKFFPFVFLEINLDMSK
eukprot:TRINITY_DN2281_c0_g1_i1.p1 TRINITY_DN2281_c0_g1~~TRINITY_DN2281_c0_g1_i1.p1  ORF type:complete len:395 (-),score=86.38 TRINITY_DN2281_c0_g1_i1:33-1187(-)